MTQEAEKYDV